MKRPVVALILGHISRYIGQLAVLIVVAALGSPTDVGHLTVSLAVAAPVFIVLSLGMRTMVLTQADTSTLGTYLRIRAVSATAAVLGSAAVLVPLLPAGARPVVLGVIALKAADQFIDLASAWLQHRHRFRLLAVVSAAAAAVNAGAAVVGALLYGAAWGVLWAGVATLVAASLVTALLQITEPPAPAAGAHGWRTIVAGGFALGVSYGGVALLSSLPQIALALTVEIEAAGRFGVLIYLAVAGELLVNPLSQAWTQSRRETLRASPRPTSLALREVARYSAVLVPLFACAVAAGALLIGPVLGSFYTPSAPEAVAILVCMALMPAVFLGAASLAIQNLYRSSLLSIAPALVLSAAACALLVPTFGVLGAFCGYAVGLLCRAAVPFIVLGHNARRTHGG